MQTEVLCLGEMLWDCLADQPDRPEAEVVSWTSYPGGAPANVACALARLGTESTFIGCLGEDEAGDGLLETLRHYQVKTTAIQRAALPTRRVYVTRTTAGERYFSSFGRIPADQFADTRLASDQLDPELFEPAGFLVIGSLMMAFPKSAQAVLHALDLADEQFVKVFLDVNWRPVFWEEPSKALETVYALIERSDLLKLSEEEAEWLQLPTLDTLGKRFDHLEGIFITRGA
ncbi:MAG: carbohydrate kinase, partial [Gemmatimonadaceae bacterium]|nr:carbohydrate kinase [Gloeobacterales cyanobacterium ES-bin-141]